MGVKKKKKKQQMQADSTEQVVEDSCIADETPKQKKKKANTTEKGTEDLCASDETPKQKKKKADATEKETEDLCITNENPKQKKKKVSVSPTTASEESLTVFVGGIPWSVDAETLRKDFSECGKVAHVQLLTDRATGKNRGIAFISFENANGVKSALKYDGDEYGGRRLEV